MPAKKSAPLTDIERSKRIREAARELETDNDPKSFERAFDKVIQPTARTKSMSNTGPGAPWVCPECGYVPRPVLVRPNVPYLFDPSDARQKCSRYLAQIAAGERRLSCPNLDAIKSRLIA